MQHTRCELQAEERLVPALTLAAFVTMMGALALGPFFPQVADELGTSVALLGQVPALMLLLAAGLGLVIGPLADQYGYRRTLVISLLTVAVSALGTGLAPTFLVLLLASLIGAVGRAAVVPTAQAVVGTHLPDEDRRRRAVSWIAMGTTSSVLLGIPLLTTVAAFSHWRVSLLVAGGLAVGISVLLWRLLAADAPSAGPAPRLRTVLDAYTPLWQHRPTLVLIGTSFLANTGTWVMFTYLGAYLVEVHGASTSEVGGGYLPVGVGAVLGSGLAGARLGVGPWTLLMLTRSAAGLLIATALLLPLPMLAAVASLALSAVALPAGTAATAVPLVGESPAGRATTMTFNNSSLSLGAGVGGVLGGLALALGGYPAVGLVALAWLFAAAGLIGWLRPREVPTPALAAP